MSGTAPDLGQLSALKLTQLAREVRGRMAGALRADPIAIVGMACRVPGAASPDGLWDLLAAGGEAISEIPADRWNADDWYDADISTLGKSVTRRGGFLDRIDGFDSDFFGILAREADAMDPQQRLFLECAIEAIDDAGLSWPELRGSATGVFTASYHNDYGALSYADPDAIDLRTLTGTQHSVVANRLSFFLDLRGPSVSVDTACSSSLVAIHLACQSLRMGECDVALAGGVSVIVSPELMVALSKVGFMAPDGRCKTFDAEADGFGRGEGCGVIALRRLSDAVAAGDRIHAVIRGSAVNQDGESTLLTAPNGPAQEALIREALAAAQVAPGTVSFVEAHGTGTALGDPIEVGALAATVGRGAGAAPCYLGSAKANLGHLEAAAGVVGTIKAVLTLDRRTMPPPAAYRSLSPHIDLSGTRLRMPAGATPLASEAPLRAGVSGFGVGGTNAHVVLEEAPRVAAVEETAEGPLVLPLSARSPGALREMAARVAAHLRATPDRFEDVAHTAAMRRTHHRWRTAVAAQDAASAAERLEALIPDLPEPGAAARAPGRGPVFVFCGQGPQRPGMGLSLADRAPVFGDALAEAAAALERHCDLSVIEELSRPEGESRLASTDVAQATLFALHVALTALWRARGIAPAAVIGHSVGEISALHAAGALDLETAARIVAHRGRTMRPFEGMGAMASVALDEAASRALAARVGGLEVAAVNGPRTTVLAGAPDAVAAAADACGAEGVQIRTLPVRYAFHSAQMDPARAPFLTAIGSATPGRVGVPVYSTVTGDRLDAVGGSEHFARNLRDAVRFHDAVRSASDDGHDLFLEIGPHPVLAGAIAASAASDSDGVGARTLASLRHGRDEETTVAEATAGLYAAGLDPDWSAIAPQRAVVSLPSYPWQRRRHWLPERRTRAAQADATGVFHPLLGRRTHVAGSGVDLFEGDGTAAMGWLGEHVVGGRTLLPGAAIFEAMAAAAADVAGTPALEDAVILVPVDLAPQDDTPRRWQLSATPDADGRRRLEWRVRQDGDWRLVATAATTAAVHDAWEPAEDGRDVASSDVDAWLDAQGLDFGPSFRLLRDVRLGTETASARATCVVAGDGHLLHPTLIDAGLQLASAIAGLATERGPRADTFLPVAVDGLALARGDMAAASGEVVIQARLRETFETSLSADLRFEDADGRLLGTVRGARFAPARSLDGAAVPLRTYETRWRAVRSPAGEEIPASPERGAWIVLDAVASRDASRRIVASLNDAGLATHVAEASESAAALGGPEGAREVLKAALRAHGQIAGLLFCHGLDDPGLDDAFSIACDDAAILALHTAQAVVDAEQGAPRVVVLTRGGVAAAPGETGRPDAAAVRALFGAAADEHPSLPLRALDLDPSGDLPSVAELISEGPRWSAVRGSEILAPRVLRREREDGPRMQRLERTGEAAADAVRLAPLRPEPLRGDEVRIAVRASALNFRDVLSNLGLYPGEVPLGAECAGVVAEVGSPDLGLAPGDRVMALAPGSHATEAVAKAHLVARAPEGLSDAEAAATPVAAMTALYGLAHLAGLRSGETVLIHAATGGVGLAAVAVARRIGARILATAGTPDKRALLHRLGIETVCDSRSPDFGDAILAATEGRGVDVVLNALADDFVAESWRVLTQGGRFVEIGKRGVLTPEDAAARRPDAAYHLLDFGTEAEDDPALFGALAAELASAYADGTLPPPRLREMPLTDAPEALRTMVHARHVGKLVLRAGHPRFEVHPDGWYLITGGLGAIGLDAARWLVANGARRLALVGRGAPDAGARDAIAALERDGADVAVHRCDAADLEEMRAVFESLGASGPVRGVIHAAGSLRDGVLSRLTADDVRAVFRGKVGGAAVLDRLTAGTPLDFLVLFSSAAARLGSRGQAAYLAANAAVEALAQGRRARGLPALGVAPGPWAGAGMAEILRASGNTVWMDRGVLPVEPGDVFDEIGRLVGEGAANAMIARIDWPKFLDGASDDETFEAFATGSGRRGDKGGRDEAKAAIPARLRAGPAAGRKRALEEVLSGYARRAMGVDGSTAIPPGTALRDLGLDSLMAVELRNMLVRDGGRPLPATLLFDFPTVEALIGKVASVWEVPLEDATAGMPDDRVAADPLSELSAEEALRQLEAELTGAEGPGEP